MTFSKRSRSNDAVVNVTLHMANILPIGLAINAYRVKGNGKIYANGVIKM